MFPKTILISAFAALAAAQSSVLTFTKVPNPVTDGQPQAITYATNDTMSVSNAIARQTTPGQCANCRTASDDPPSQRQRQQPPDHRDSYLLCHRWPVHLDSARRPRERQRLCARDPPGQPDKLLRSVPCSGRQRLCVRLPDVDVQRIDDRDHERQVRILCSRRSCYATNICTAAPPLPHPSSQSCPSAPQAA